MLKAEESGLLDELNDRLRKRRKLYVERAEAQSQRNQTRVAELQTEIDELTEDCDKVLAVAGAV